MNKSFILLDKNNNLQKNANVIVKFNVDGINYLVYSVEENEQNSQIFVSKIVLNSEGKYFIDNIMLEEKNKLNNIVYNIVILVPTEAQKGATFETLSNNLLDKFSVKLSIDIPELGMQEYFSNCSVAITSKVLVDSAVNFYEDNLKSSSDDGNVLVPTWTAPEEATVPTPMNASDNIATQPVGLSNTSIPVQETVAVTDSAVSINNSEEVSNLNLQSVPSSETVVNSSNAVQTSNPASTTSAVVNSVETNSVGVVSNPQVEKLAVVSDPSLGLGVQQPNVGKTKKAGFANTKYIVIGTVCIVLAVVVVIAAYILISNMQ